jgi:tetratricopeptide (TPR) repeat protein
MNNLGVVCVDTRQLPRALALFEETLKKRQVRLPPDHPHTLTTMNNLAMTYRLDGQLAKALPLLEQALEKQQAQLGSDHPDTLNTLGNVAAVQFDLRRYAAAAPLLTRWLERQRPRLPADHLGVAFYLSLLGQCQIVQENPAAAEKSLRDSLAIYEKKQPQSVQRHHTESVLGAALVRQKKYDEAELPLVRSANALKADATRLAPPYYRLLLDAVLRVIDLYDAWDRPDDAARWRKELATLQKAAPTGTP